MKLYQAIRVDKHTKKYEAIGNSFKADSLKNAQRKARQKYHSGDTYTINAFQIGGQK